MKKFFGVIGNPPYQADQNGRTLPVYDKFMDAAYEVGEKVELVTPGRFLFNAGQTHKPWNKKMLDDPHFKVLAYYADGKDVFPGIELMGGVAISLHDQQEEFGSIGVFVPFNELRSALAKVLHCGSFISLGKIVFTSSKYNLANIYEEHPDYKQYVKSDGKHSQIDTNAFGKMPIFTQEMPTDGDDYIQLYGRYDNKRALWWVKRKFIIDSGNIEKYKIFIPKANGASGTLGENAARLISLPAMGEPHVGSTQSFLSIGNFDSEEEAAALMKYIRSKFARAMLGTLKITQDNSAEKWRNIPLQNFASDSDIDWSKSIAEIDQQLYAKYGLDQDEIDFIESHVVYLKEA